ncbi:protein neprosin-like [Bidens hawaiensis]|uniref:protein neprosin-like n=1 Tax=Bidens hawaiensis TaxID=980011 RepID=UPI00404928A1
MKSGSCDISTIIYVLVLFSLLFSPIFSMEGNKLENMKSINALLRKINKPFIKSIESPDNDDIIDCVLFNLQPTFDNPELRASMTQTIPKLPEGDDSAENNQEIKQLWNSNGESCPNETISIRRTTASELTSISKYGKKYSSKGVQGEQIHEIWVISDSSDDNKNTVEAGWQGRSSGNWWLRVGTEVVGYWPASLFTDLRNHAKTVEYGGEVMYENSGRHTSTQMGSGHFEGGPGKTAYTRNLKVVDSNNVMKDVSNLQILADKPNFYSIQKGYNDVYRNYIYILEDLDIVQNVLKE